MVLDGIPTHIEKFRSGENLERWPLSHYQAWTLKDSTFLCATLKWKYWICLWNLGFLINLGCTEIESPQSTACWFTIEFLRHLFVQALGSGLLACLLLVTDILAGQLNHDNWSGSGPCCCLWLRDADEFWCKWDGQTGTGQLPGRNHLPWRFDPSHASFTPPFSHGWLISYCQNISLSDRVTLRLVLATKTWRARGGGAYPMVKSTKSSPSVDTSK